MVPRQKHPVEDLTRSLLDESLVTATDCSEYGLSRKGWSWSNKAIYCLCASLFPLCFCVFIPLQFVYLDFWTRSLPGFVCFYSGLTLFFFSSRAFLFRSVPFFWISHRASSLSRRLRLRFSRIVKKKKVRGMMHRSREAGGLHFDFRFSVRRRLADSLSLHTSVI